jgi:hypothetical protein
MVQAGLVAALVAGADPPPGMGGDRIRVQAAALVRKRGRAVSRAQPELAVALGSQFGAAFAGYAGTRPTPGSAVADAEEFALYLRAGRRTWDRDVRRAARRVMAVWPPRIRRPGRAAGLPESLP